MRNRRIIGRVTTKLCLVAALLSLTACDLLPPGKAEKIEFLDRSYAVTMPASWSVRSDLNDIADLQMGNLFKEAYTIVISESKEDFDNLSLQGHSDLTRSLIRNGLTNYQESGPETLRVGPNRALRYRISGTLDGLNLVYWHVTIETGKRFHQMLLWSLKSKFAANEADYDALINSFAVLRE